MKRIFALLLIFVCVGFSQTNKSSTIAAGDSIGTAIKLLDKEIPSAIYLGDSLSTEPSFILFYVHIGDTTGLGNDLSNWDLLTVPGDTSGYVVRMKRGMVIPLDPLVFYPLLSSTTNYYSQQGLFYMKPFISGGSTTAATLWLRLRSY